MKFPAIGSLSGVKDKATLLALRPIKQILETLLGQIGDGNDAVLTRRTLGGLVQDALDTGTVTIPPGVGYDPAADTTPPPTPTGLLAKGAIKTIILRWDDVGGGYYNHAYAEVWRNTVNSFDGNQQQVGTAEGSVWIDETASQGVTYYYWIRFVSQAGIIGVFNGGTNQGAVGTLGQAGQGDLAVNSIVAGDGVIGLLAVDTALIADAAINTFKLGNGSVTNAKISGAIQSDNYNPGLVGWVVNKNGAVEFNTGTFRGGLYVGGTLQGTNGTFNGTVYVENLEGDVIDRVVVDRPNGQEYSFLDTGGAYHDVSTNIEVINISQRSFPRTCVITSLVSRWRKISTTYPQNTFYIQVYYGVQGSANTLLFNFGPFSLLDLSRPYHDPADPDYGPSIIIPPDLQHLEGNLPYGSIYVTLNRPLAFNIPAYSQYQIRVAIRDVGIGLYGSVGRFSQGTGRRDVQVFKQASGTVSWAL